MDIQDPKQGPQSSPRSAPALASALIVSSSLLAGAVIVFGSSFSNAASYLLLSLIILMCAVRLGTRFGIGATLVFALFVLYHDHSIASSPLPKSIQTDDYLSAWTVLASGLALCAIVWAYASSNTVSEPEAREQDRDESLQSAYEREIAAHMETQRQLERERRQFRDMAESVPVTVWTTLADGTPEYINQHWYEYTGSSDADDLLEVWQKCMHPDDRGYLMLAYNSSFRDFVPLDVQYRLRRASDNMYRWHLVRAVPVKDETGSVQRWFGTLTDIHDQKQAEMNQTILARLGTRLHSLTDPNDIIWQAVCLLGEHLEVSRCVYAEIDHERDLVVVHRDYCKSLPSIAGAYPDTLFGPDMTDEADRGVTMVYNDLQSDERSRNQFESIWAPIGIRAIVSIPVLHDDLLVGSLALHSAEPREWTTAEIALVEQVAQVARLAMLNAQLLQDQVAAAKRTEESLALLSALLSAAPVGFGFLDRDFRYVKANDALAAITGVSKETMVGSLIRDIVPDIWPKVEANYKKVLSSGEPIINSEVQGETLAYPGVVRYWLSNYYPVKTEDGDILGIGIVVTDITNRKESEETIRRLNETLHLRVSEFQTLFDIVPIGIALAADPQCQVIYHNPTLAAWLGHEIDRNVSSSAHAQAGQGFTIIQDGRTLKPEELPLQRAASTGEEIRDWEADFLLPDGTVKHLLGFASPVYDQDGTISRSIGAFVDITLQNRAERERTRHVEEVELLNVQLQRAMSETHHRVKNNLQVIAAMLDMQDMQYSDSLPTQEIVRLKQHIRTLASIHDLLTKSARDDADVYGLSLRDTIDKLGPMVQEMAQERLIRFEFDDVLMPVRQTTSIAVLVNELVSNSVKHGNGSIYVRFEARDGVGELSVTDHGTGFRQGFDSSKEANTGLDLVDSLTRWDLRGTVRYDNADHGGGRVVLTFPLPADQRTEGEQ